MTFREDLEKVVGRVHAARGRHGLENTLLLRLRLGVGLRLAKGATVLLFTIARHTDTVKNPFFLLLTHEKVTRLLLKVLKTTTKTKSLFGRHAIVFLLAGAAVLGGGSGGSGVDSGGDSGELVP